MSADIPTQDQLQAQLSAYMNSQIKSNPTNSKKDDVTVKNNLGLTVKIYPIDQNGQTQDPITVKDDDKETLHAAQVGNYYLVTLVNDTYVTILQVADLSDSFNLTNDYLVSPNEIGYPPNNFGAMDVPPQTTTAVLVGIGNIKDVAVTREQYWYMTDLSYQVMANQDFQQTISMTEGVEDSQTVIKTVSAMVGSSVSLGWGPIAASISASMGYSAQTNQTVTLTELQTVSKFISFPSGPEAFTVLIYQFIDRYSFWKNTDHSTPDVITSFEEDSPLPYGVKINNSITPK